jgi:muramoyltetrapeptide carboxypeptidase
MENESTKPHRLKPGDTIGIAAPASPFDAELFNRGIEVIKSMGFQAFLPKDIWHNNGYLAGSDVHRAQQLNSLFSNPSIHAVVCAKGGYGAMRILPHLNYEAIEKNPKIIVGFSDITALLNTLNTKCRLATFHGPLITTLANATQEAKDALYAVLAGDKPIQYIVKKGMVVRSGTVTAPLAGGNLCTLCHLLGTDYQPDFDGHILFLEDNGEKPYRIDRMLTQMKMAGMFDNLAGLLLGTFSNCGDTKELVRIAEDIFNDESVPILAGFDAGHIRKNLTLPFGIPATLDANGCTLTFREPCTSG